MQEDDAIGEQMPVIDGLHRQFDTPGLDPGQIEHLVDQFKQMATGLEDFIHILATVFIQAAVDFQQLGKADDRIHWRAQFVTHAREEFRLGPIGLVRLAHGLLQLLLTDDFLATVLKNIETVLQLAATRIDNRIAIIATDEFAAVLAPCTQVTAPAVTAPITGGDFGERFFLPRRQPPAEVATPHLVGGIAEQTLVSRIDIDDAAGMVGHANRLLAGFDQATENLQLAMLGRISLAFLATTAQLRQQRGQQSVEPGARIFDPPPIEQAHAQAGKIAADQQQQFLSSTLAQFVFHQQQIGRVEGDTCRRIQGLRADPEIDLRAT